MAEAEKGKYSFIVAQTAHKEDIKKAVEKNFSVNVISVMTIVVKGKRKRAGRNRQKVAGSVLKKAIVELKTGQKISLFELGA